MDEVKSRQLDIMPCACACAFACSVRTAASSDGKGMRAEFTNSGGGAVRTPAVTTLAGRARACRIR
jgi:hypothetical protein